ncbi:hypothetical protein AwWohl_06250 [Gammaproteobacteria bacterium]|nr:hypothetical protein AwWohl_06250 [Gammaproteobacteria bacterium]
MQHYVDITLLPNDEVGHYFLWGKLYQQMHLAMVAHNRGDNGVIGFSFPEYRTEKARLGSKLRIFAPTKDELTELNIAKWLSRFSDYCHISSIKQVPEHTQYALFSRRHCRTNIEGLVRRRVKRKGESLEQAREYFVGYTVDYSLLPFVELESLSSDNLQESRNKFKLFIEQKIITEKQSGQFNCYGLSKIASAVPWF